MIETTEQLYVNDQVLVRNQDYKGNNGLGPVDLCILKKEIRNNGLKFFFHYKAKITKSYFYIYGVDTSSLASISLYFKQVFDYFLRCGKGKVVSGMFCVYDLFSQCDLRVEIEIPGTAKAYLLTKNNEIRKVDEVHWEGCYLSSVLRYLNPSYSKVNFIDHFSVPDQFETFFELVFNYLDKTNIGAFDSTSIEQDILNRIFESINKFLLSRRLYKVHQGVYRRFVGKYPILLTFLSESCAKEAEYEEIFYLLSNQIKISPHVFPLYYAIGRVYYKKGEFLDALKICQYLIELQIEGFHYWKLLIRCLIRLKMFSAALICFNSIPVQSGCNTLLNTQKPSDKKIDYSNKSNYLSIKTLDFLPTEERSIIVLDKENRLLKTLESLPGNKYNSTQKIMYSLLVKIERGMRWDQIFSLRSSVFKLTNPINDFVESTNALKSPAPQPDHEAQNIVITPMTFKIKSEQKLNQLFESLPTYQADLTTDYLKGLRMDLNLFLEYKKENTMIKGNLENNGNEVNYSGVLWILRGRLAERLKRYATALGAYFKAIGKGVSVYAWYKIAKLSCKVGNPDNAVGGIVKVFDIAKLNRVKIEVAPEWVDKILGRLCAECGFRQVNSLIQEKGSNHQALLSSMQKLYNQKVEGLN